MDTLTAQVTFEHAHAALVFKRSQGMDAQLGAGRELRHIAFEATGTQQKAHFHRTPGAASLVPSIGGHALGHQLQAQPGGQAAVGAVELTARADRCTGMDLFVVAAVDAVDEDHICGMRQQFGQWPGVHGASPRIRLTLLPPKANELLIRRRGLRRQALAAIDQFRAGNRGRAGHPRHEAATGPLGCAGSGQANRTPLPRRRRPQGMAGHGLAGGAGHAIAEQTVHGEALHGVVVDGGGAVQVQVVDLCRR